MFRLFSSVFSITDIVAGITVIFISAMPRLLLFHKNWCDRAVRADSDGSDNIRKMPPVDLVEVLQLKVI